MKLMRDQLNAINGITVLAPDEPQRQLPNQEVIEVEPVLVQGTVFESTFEPQSCAKNPDLFFTVNQVRNFSRVFKHFSKSVTAQIQQEHLQQQQQPLVSQAQPGVSESVKSYVKTFITDNIETTDIPELLSKEINRTVKNVETDAAKVADKTSETVMRTYGFVREGKVGPSFRPTADF